MSLLLALVAAAPLAASEPAPPVPSPALSVDLDDRAGSLAWRPTFSPGKWTLTPVFKAGALALTDSFPSPYPVLKTSPFGLLGLKAVYHGAMEAAVVATVGAVRLRSERLLPDPTLELATTATKHPGRELAQTQAAESLYLDVGKTFRAGGWKAAVYATLGEFGYAPLPSTDHGPNLLAETSVGTVWRRESGPHEVTLTASAVAEASRRDFYRNEMNPALTPSARAGAEYAVRSGGLRYGAGVQGETRRSDDVIRPYVDLTAAGMKALLAMEMRRAKDPFYADATAVAASVRVRAARDLTVGVTARGESRRYALAPGPETDASVMVDLTWTPRADAAVRAAKEVRTRHAGEYDAERQRRLNAASAADPRREGVRAAIAASPTLDGFLGAYKPGDEAGVLAAVSELTALFDRYNYNTREGAVRNLDSVGEIYGRARQSYLSSSKDPTLVCLGAAQSAAAIAVELGRRNGVPLAASAITVEVADADGRRSGHATAAVKTREHGIVFVDWGRMIPTYTFDTRRALALYQALVGMPAVMHEVTDPDRNGRHVGYLFTEEGKAYVRALTFHGELARPPLGELFDDDPRTDPLAEKRYTDLLGR